MNAVATRVVAALAAFALIALAALVVLPTPAHAQVFSGRVVCHAASAYAAGVGVSFNGQEACNIAQYQCALRTPSYGVCYVTRWYYEVI